MTGELAQHLLGPPGSKVVLGMLRKKTERVTVELSRQWPTRPTSRPLLANA